MIKKSANIVYYSGTGGTLRVAKAFENAFLEVGFTVNTQRLFQNRGFDLLDGAMLVLIYAVHACNAPEPVYHWLESIPNVNGIHAVVISVSGGGEIVPNTACRVSTIKKLERKGYSVTYEKMIVMPSNWIIGTKEPLAQTLINVLPRKVEAIVSDICGDKLVRNKPIWVDRILSHLGEFEKSGARSFGKKIVVSDQCTQCEWCINNCPAGNISPHANAVAFGGKCHLCLACIYGCPQKALKPGMAKFVVIKEGYDLCELEKREAITEEVDIEQLTKGYIWSGLRRYLLDK